MSQRRVKSCALARSQTPDCLAGSLVIMLNTLFWLSASNKNKKWPYLPLQQAQVFHHETESARINNKIQAPVGRKNGWLCGALWRGSGFSVYVANFLLCSVFLKPLVVDYSLLCPKIHTVILLSETSCVKECEVISVLAIFFLCHIFRMERQVLWLIEISQLFWQQRSKYTEQLNQFDPPVCYRGDITVTYFYIFLLTK